MAGATIAAIFLFLFSILFATNLTHTIEPRRSQVTHLMVMNLASKDIVKTVVSAIDSYDWEDGEGPGGNFQNIYIKVGTNYERREEVNYSAKNCPFTMALHFADGKIATYRVNQKYAIGKADSGFKILEGTHIINAQRVGDKMLMITVADPPKPHA